MSDFVWCITLTILYTRPLILKPGSIVLSIGHLIHNQTLVCLFHKLIVNIFVHGCLTDLLVGLLMSVKLLLSWVVLYYQIRTLLFCRYFLCPLSYYQQFVWYPGYHGPRLPVLCSFGHSLLQRLDCLFVKPITETD